MSLFLTKVASALEVLTLPMPRLLSSKAQGRKVLGKLSKPYHVGIHLIALAEHSQMSTHVPGFQSFFRFFASFCIGQSSLSIGSVMGVREIAVTTSVLIGRAQSLEDFLIGM